MPKSLMTKRFKLTLLFIFVATLFLDGCATQKKLRILWPAPPNDPMLEFVGAYASKSDLIQNSVVKFIDKSIGKRPAIMGKPFGIVSDGNGRIYVADTGYATIWFFDFNNKKTGHLTNKVRLKKPLGLDMDEKGNIYVVDGGIGKIVVLSPRGEFLHSFGDDLFGIPAYIAINDNLGRIYVSDGKKHRIAVFNAQGKHLFFIGKPGNRNGEFAAPQGLAIDQNNRLFVADMLNSRIQVFDSDGNFLYTFGVQGAEQWRFENPKDLAFSDDGRLHIIDYRKALLLTYTPEGKLLLVTGGSKRTSHPLGFSTPTAIDIDKNNRISISDRLNRRFTIWQNISAEDINKESF